MSLNNYLRIWTLELNNITLGKSLLFRRDARLRTLSIKKTFASNYSISTSQTANSDGITVTNVKIDARIIPVLFEFGRYRDAVAYREELIHFFSPYHKYEAFITRNQIRRRIECVMYHIDDDPIENVYDWYQFNMELLCPDPYFTDETDTNMTFLSTIPKISFPFAFPMGVGMTTGIPHYGDTLEINNSGDVEIGAVITVDVYGGDIVNPKITRTADGVPDESISIFRVFKAGTKIVINTNFRQENIYVNGESDTRWEWGSDFFKLLPGINKVKVDAAYGVGNARTSVSFRRKWLGV